MKKKNKVVIADDHEMFLDGVNSILSDQQHIEVVFKAKNGLEAINYIKSNPVDLLISDISMPTMDGIELCNLVRNKHPDIKTLILSTHNDPILTDKLVKSGVNGYLLKNAGKTMLLKCIDAVLKNDQFFDADVKEKFIQHTFENKKTETIQLSKREKEILILITEEFTANEIAEKLFISQNTVNTHRKNLLSKLNVKNTAGLVRYALENNVVN